MAFRRIQRNTVKKARKFVLRKTNLRALRDFDIILCLGGGGINLVSTSHFRRFFQIVRAKNPCNIKVFLTTQQPLWYLAIFLLVSSRQKFLSFSFLHFLCIFSEDDATFGKDISRPNHSFFLISFKKILRKQKRLAGILLHEKRRKRGKYAEK